MDEKKIIIITGANSGLGFECARKIARSSQEYRVVLACRNRQKAQKAQSDIIKESGNSNIHAMELDVSSLASVRAFVRQYHEQDFSPLYGLICNAGIPGMNTALTPEGFDTVFATNHLGHFLLANLLLPSIQPSGRIIAVSSDMHSPPGPTLTWPGAAALAHPQEKLAGSRSRYSYSKLCNLYFTYELARRLARINSKITVNAFNPGLMTETNFAPAMPGFAQFLLKKAVADRVGSLAKSSIALAELMTEPCYAQASGDYYDRSTEQRQSSPLSYSRENALELWDMSVLYTKLAPGEALPGILLRG